MQLMQMTRRPAIRILQLDVGNSLDQRVDSTHLTTRGRNVQCTTATITSSIHVNLISEDGFPNSNVPLGSGLDECRRRLVTTSNLSIGGQQQCHQS